MSTNNINNKSKYSLRTIAKILLKIALFFIVIGVLIGVFASGAGAGYFASLVKDEPIASYDEMKSEIYNYEETSKIYFADNKYMGDITAPLQREEINLDDIAPILIDAVLATEDKDFYEHNGIVPKAIARAAFQEFSGAEVQTGGSTLTQQLIKNQMLTNEVSFERKAKEILLALRLENNFEKEEILEAYLNVIPYGRETSGRNIAGILKASQGIFDVDPDELNIAQAAYLAGLPQNPYTYTPFTNEGEIKNNEGLQPGLDRMEVVLNRMHSAEVITKEEYDEAIDYDITKDFTENDTSPREKYPVLVFEIEKRAKKILMEEEASKDDISLSDLNDDQELKEEYEEIADRALRMNGYDIHTTINKEMYESMQTVAKEYEYYGPDRTFEQENPNTGETESITQPIQTGAVLMENESGKIISFVGNRNASVDNHFNFAMNAKRGAGSTIKPIGVYAPGMDLGAIQPGTILPDIPGRKYGEEPAKNYSKTHYGLVSAREALTNSYNVSTVEAYKKIVDQNPAKNYLGKMNISLPDEVQTNLSFALGSVYLSVEDNTKAFASLANNGQFNESYMIEKITSKDEETVFEHESKPTEVYSPQAAYLTIDIMRDVLKQGTGTYMPTQLTTSGVDWAGKTGTTQDFHDAWFIGTNPNVTLSTWIGYETDASIRCDNCSLSYSQRTQKLWANLINETSEIDPELMAPKEKFEEPEDIVTRDYCAISGLAPSKLCSDIGLVYSDIYDAKHVPSETDDSLVGSDEKTQLVRVDGKEVIAGDKTPSEFTFSSESTGYAFNPEFLKKNNFDQLDDLSALFPRTNRDTWEKISLSAKTGAASSSIKDSGKSPSEPSNLNVNGSQLSWDAASGNVVGYRIYSGSSVIDSTTSTSITLSNGTYNVKAVDYFGRESSASDNINLSVKSDDTNDNQDDKDSDSKEENDDVKDTDKKDNNDDEEKEDSENKEKDDEKNKDKDKNKEKDKEDKKDDEKDKEDKKKEEKEKEDKDKNNKDENNNENNNEENNNDKNGANNEENNNKNDNNNE